jgi:hypothetical protein
MAIELSDIITFMIETVRFPFYLNRLRISSNPTTKVGSPIPIPTPRAILLFCSWSWSPLEGGAKVGLALDDSTTIVFTVVQPAGPEVENHIVLVVSSIGISVVSARESLVVAGSLIVGFCCSADISVVKLGG